MWVSRFSTVWITWEDKVHVVELEAVDQTKWVTKYQSCEPLYDVQKFNYTIGFKVNGLNPGVSVVCVV